MPPGELRGLLMTLFFSVSEDYRIEEGSLDDSVKSAEEAKGG